MLLHQKVLHGLPLAKKSQVLVGHVPCGRGSPSSWAEGTFRLWVVWPGGSGWWLETPAPTSPLFITFSLLKTCLGGQLSTGDRFRPRQKGKPGVLRGKSVWRRHVGCALPALILGLVLAF